MEGTLGQLRQALAVSDALERLPDYTKAFIEIGGNLLPLRHIRSSVDADGRPVWIISANTYKED